MLRSLGLRSDLLVQRGLSVVQEHTDRVILRTPDEPDYWSGNAVIFRHPPGDIAADLARFQADFPGAAHVYLYWDAPDLDPAPLAAPCAALGLSVEVSDVLLLRGPVVPAPLPAGLTWRPLAQDDWAQAIDLYHAVDVADGYPDNATHRAFVTARFRARAWQVAQGQGGWFGVFDGPRMVAGMGLFHDRELGRFQSIVTAPSHRRRGICAGLLTQVALWARARVPALPLVIIAEPDGAPGRIYRRAGFLPHETFVAAMRRGY